MNGPYWRYLNRNEDEDYDEPNHLKGDEDGILAAAIILSGVKIRHWKHEDVHILEMDPPHGPMPFWCGDLTPEKIDKIICFLDKHVKNKQGL